MLFSLSYFLCSRYALVTIYCPYPILLDLVLLYFNFYSNSQCSLLNVKRYLVSIISYSLIAAPERCQIGSAYKFNYSLSRLLLGSFS